MEKINPKEYLKKHVRAVFDAEYDRPAFTAVSKGRAFKAIDMAEAEMREKIQNLILSDIDAPIFTHTEQFRKHFDYIKKCFLKCLDE